jgi:acyl-CoA thioester hydrolase
VIAKEIVFGAQFYEADPMGVVWHGRYVKYFERVRTAMFEDLGFGYKPMTDSGYVWPVVELNVKYLRPIQPGQRVIARAELVEWDNRIVLDYAILDQATGEKLTKGRTVQVAVVAATGEMIFEIPAILRDKIVAKL